VQRELWRLDSAEVDRDLPVPELPDVEVPGRSIEVVSARPAEEDVAHRLAQPLALDDPLTVAHARTAAEHGLEHRRLRFLELQEERIAFVPAEQQENPAARADAADADDLAREVAVAKSGEQMTAIRL